MVAVALVGAVERDHETLARQCRQRGADPALPISASQSGAVRAPATEVAQHEAAPLVAEPGEQLVADVLPDQAVAAAEALRAPAPCAPR